MSGKSNKTESKFLPQQFKHAQYVVCVVLCGKSLCFVLSYGSSCNGSVEKTIVKIARKWCVIENRNPIGLNGISY